MVKHLLSCVLFSALCLAASAQTFAPTTVKGLKLDKQAVVAPNVKKAPAKASLANNQRLIGYYTTDDAAEGGGLSIGSLCTGTIIPAVLLEKDLDYAQFIGAKVVGVRFHLPQGAATGVVIYDASGDYMTELASKDENITTTGWNTVMLDEADQFTLTADKTALLVGTKITQEASNYPIGVNPNLSGRTLFIYCNYPSSAGGNGEAWYNFGTSYTLTIQLLLEDDNFPTNGVMPVDFGKFTVGLNKSQTKTVTLYNAGTSLNNFSYTVTQDGTTSEEQTDTLDTPLGIGGSTTADVAFPAAAQAGTYDVTLNITKVNGETNGSSITTATGKNITVGRELPKASVVEEFTGTTCGWCPRGHVGMGKLRQQYGDKFIGVALHQYTVSTSKDAMYISDQQPDLGFDGAPQCVINRSGSFLDPYYGSYDDIRGDFPATLAVLPEVGVTASATWNTDQTEVTVTANFEALTTGTYEAAYYLVADSLHGTTQAWKQYNYYSSGYSSKTGITKSDLEGTDFEFLWSKGTTYAATFNDVMIASSYKSTVDATYGSITSSENQADDVELVDGQTTTGTYTLKMPTRTALKNAINKDLVYAVVLAIDPYGEVVNATKVSIKPDPTGIQEIATDGVADSTIVARYTANGQQVSAPVKGLNILKLANGQTVKVVVK